MKNQFYVGISALSLAVSLNAITISDVLAKTGCFVESDNYVYCYNSSGVQQKLEDRVAGTNYYEVTSYTTDGDKLTVTRKNGYVEEFTYDTSANTVTNKHVGGYNTGLTSTYTFDNNGNRISRVGHLSSLDSYDFTETYDPTTGKRTSETKTYLNDRIYREGLGLVYRTTYDPHKGGPTSYAVTDVNGYTRTRIYDGNGGSETNITGRTLTDSNGQPVNGTVTSSLGPYKCTYTAENGVVTGYAYTDFNGKVHTETYDENGRKNFYEDCSSYDSKGNCEKGSRTERVYGENGTFVETYQNLDPKCGYSVKRKGYGDYGTYLSGTAIVSDSFDPTKCDINESFNKVVCLGDMETCKAKLLQKNYLCTGGFYYENCEKDFSKLVPASEADCESNKYYYWTGLSCNNKDTGIKCAENWRKMEDWCNRIRYTPAEAAAVLRDDDTNEVTITFKK